MYIYLEPNTKIEDLVNMLEEIKPGAITSRLVLEVATEDKALAMILKKMASDPEAWTAKKHTGGRKKKTSALMAAEVSQGEKRPPGYEDC